MTMDNMFNKQKIIFVALIFTLVLLVLFEITPLKNSYITSKLIKIICVFTLLLIIYLTHKNNNFINGPNVDGVSNNQTEEYISQQNTNKLLSYVFILVIMMFAFNVLVSLFY